MKNKILNKLILALAISTTFLTSCNKGFEEIPPSNTGVVTGATLLENINSNPNFSRFKDSLNRFGLLSRLGNPGSQFTVLGLDNTLMGAIAPLISTLPTANRAAFFAYHVIPQNVNAAKFANSFSTATALHAAQIPNGQHPSSLQIATTNGLPVMMNVFLAKNGSNYFANNVPIVGADAIVGSTGVLHSMAAPIMPQAVPLKVLIDTASNLTLFKALIARADSGQVGTGKIDSLMNMAAPLNFTVFAPTNNSIKGLINALSGGMVPLAAPDANFIGFINTFIPVMNARGIAFYHLLGTSHRAYSTNLPLTTSLIKTMLNNAVPIHPGITVDRSTTAPRLLGAANGAGNFSNFVTTDRNALNGVLHIIDRVLLPQ
jgi:hypothetical protein